ncbi:MAG: glycosyltransferase [Candidatus Binataceae bacterium]|nr:glycosyltransferase [Candidatus Binataceae bacterium]
MNDKRRLLYYESMAFYPSTAHFLEASQDLARGGGWLTEFFDEARFVAGTPSLAARIATRVRGGRPRGIRALNRELLVRARAFAPDVVLVGKGRYLAPATLAAIKAASGARLINWATDDPFNPANGSAALRAAIPLYDLYVSTKRAIVPALRAAGARQVIYQRFGYKPTAHYPQVPVTPAEHARFVCDVAFVGGADADRVPYFERLMRELPGVRLNLYGNYWNRSARLAPYWRGRADGRDYRLALGGAAIAVNLLRRANHDDHVMRTFELPACGAFMLAERSDSHRELFAEGREAAFFATPDELAAQVRHYLPRAAERARIAAAGRRRVLAGGHSYNDRLHEILCAAGQLVAAGGDRAGLADCAGSPDSAKDSWGGRRGDPR